MVLLTMKSTTDEIQKQTSTTLRDDITFPIVKFPFISRNMPASPAYSVYISQCIRYSRGCVQYSDFPVQSSATDAKLLKQDYLAPRLKSSLQNVYGRHHNLVDMHISNDNGSLTFYETASVA